MSLQSKKLTEGSLFAKYTLQLDWLYYSSNVVLQSILINSLGVDKFGVLLYMDDYWIF